MKVKVLLKIPELTAICTIITQKTIELEAIANRYPLLHDQLQREIEELYSIRRCFDADKVEVING